MTYVLTRLITLYQAALLVYMLLPLFGVSQRPWVAYLGKVCAPALAVGRKVTDAIFKNKRFAFDVSPIAAIVLLSVVSFIISRF